MGAAPVPVLVPGAMPLIRTFEVPLPMGKLVELLRADVELKAQTDAATWGRVDAMYTQYMVRAARLPYR